MSGLLEIPVESHGFRHILAHVLSNFGECSQISLHVHRFQCAFTVLSTHAHVFANFSGQSHASMSMHVNKRAIKSSTRFSGNFLHMLVYENMRPRIWVGIDVH